MSSLFVLPRQFVIDGSGVPRAGAKLYFYDAGTLTARDTYSDDGLTTPNTNPVVADASGTFGPIYLSTAAYRVILKDADDVQLWDQDEVNSLLGFFGSDVLTKSGSYTVTVADRGKLIQFSATATISLPALADAGKGFVIQIENTSPGTGIITIDPDSTEQINGASSLVLDPDEAVLLMNDGSTWTGLLQLRSIRIAVTAKLSGFLTDPSGPTGTLRWSKIGQFVILAIDSAITGTSDSTSLSMASVPSAIRPTVDREFLCHLTDNGVLVRGSGVISTSGGITFKMGTPPSSTGFTNSGTKGLPDGWQFMYAL